MTTTLWRFSAMDSLFFRDGRSMNMGESAWLDSLFPPSGQTLQGAIRAAILDFLDADITAFQRGQPCLPDGGSLKEEIGSASSLGSLRLTGPFVAKDEQLFFPAPLDLVQNKDGDYRLLVPSTSHIPSDQGRIALPSVAGPGYKTLAGKYICKQDMKEILQAGTKGLAPVPLIAESRDQDGLADREPKVGLARDNSKRIHREGMLFAIAPLRPREDVSLWVGVEGVTNDHHPINSFLQKLGGEGKLARITTGGALDLPGPYITQQNGRVRFKIVFITPALLQPGQLLPENKDCQGLLCQKNFGGCQLEVVTACIGKPHRIGGWDMQNWRAKPLRSFIPAGSVFFCQADAARELEVRALHNTKTGEDTEYGFGHILIGKWDNQGVLS